MPMKFFLTTQAPIVLDADEAGEPIIVPGSVAAGTYYAVVGVAHDPATIVVTEPLPVNTVLPTITGTIKEGETITLGNGTWDHMSGGTYARQLFADGVAVTGATGTTFVPTAAEAGKILTLRVGATNAAGGPVYEYSLPTVAVAPAGSAIQSFGIFGQSNLQYPLGAVSPWDNIVTGRPVITTENMTWFGTKQGRGVGTDSEFEKFPVTTANIAARNVSASVGSLSAVLAYAMPGVQFALIDLAVSGTGRRELKFDGTIETGRGRNWPDYEGIIDFARPDIGDLKNILEFWYANDQGSLSNFLNAFAPFYFGEAGNGAPASVGVAELDHMLWDITAAGGDRGRGIFARDITKYIPVMPRPDYSLDKRLGPQAFTEDSRVQTFLGHVSPAPLMGAWDGGHPLADDPDGGIYTMHGLAAPIMKAAGMDLKYPEVVGIETGPGGAYVDLVVTLPNGGNLTTIRALEGRGTPAAPIEDYQAVMGVEVKRAADAASARFAVVPATNLKRASKYRGTVAIQDAGTGSGADRRGRARITLQDAVASGDVFNYLKGYEYPAGNCATITKGVAAQTLTMVYTVSNGVGSPATFTITRSVSAIGTFVPSTPGATEGQTNAFTPPGGSYAPFITKNPAAAEVNDQSAGKVLFTFTPPGWSASPGATITRVLTLNGVDITNTMFGSDNDRQVVNKVWLNYMIETIPSLRDTSAMYPWPGVAVAPSFTDWIADTTVAPSNPIGTPTILANSAWTSAVANHESAAFTPSGTGAVYVIVAAASGLGTGTAEVIATATIGAAGRAVGTGTALVAVANNKKSRTSLAIYRVDAPVASAQTIQIGYTANNPLAMRIVVVQIPYAKSAAPVSIDLYANSLGLDEVTMTPSVASAYNGVLYALTKGNALDTQAITTADVAVLFEGTNGPAQDAGTNGASRLLIGFEVPGAAGAQSTTISWPSVTASFRGAAVQVEPI